MDLRGKVAIVTGGAQGIGKAISKYFLNAGMKLLICDVNDLQAKILLDDLSEELRQNVKYQKCDVTSYDEFKAAFETAKLAFGKIDILVNNAGIVNESQWRKMVEVNFIGVVHGIHLAYSYMGKNNGGSGGYIINTASSQGLEACELVPVYSATKYGVVGLTRSYGHQYHYDKTGIIVNAVCPGATVTALYQEFPNRTVTDAEYTKKFRAGVSPVSPDEVAKAVLQLLHDGRNGAIISIDDKGTRYEE